MTATIKIILISLCVIVLFTKLNILNTEESKVFTINSDGITDNHLHSNISYSLRLIFNDFLWQRLDKLRQWKKRRRISTIGRKQWKESDELRQKRSELKLESLMQTIDLLQTRSKLTVSVEHESSLVTKFKQQWPVILWRENGLYTDEYLMLINSHWLQFPPPDPMVNYVLGGVYIVIMFVCCTGNALVVLMYLRCRSLRTPGNILVANLALSDFLMLAKTPVFIFNSFNLGPALGKSGCIIYGFVGGLTGTTSIATLSAIALDRYWAVVRPLEPLRALTAIRARVMAVAAWLYAAIFASIPAFDFGYGRYVPEGYLTSCSFDYLTEEQLPRIFIFIFFCAAWLVPFFTISFCYLNIFRVVVYKRNITANNQEQRLSTRHVKERARRKAEIKLAFLVMAVIALFFVSWTPYAVVALMGIFGKKDLITPISSMIPALFCKTAACINPFIYIITHPNFRKEFKKLIYRDKSRRMGGTITSIDTDKTKVHSPSRDLSDTDVEVVQMKDIPFANEDLMQKAGVNMNTISSRISDRESSQRSMSMKTFEEGVVSPPSWFSKPKFAKKKSFQRRSTKSVSSLNTGPKF